MASTYPALDWSGESDNDSGRASGWSKSDHAHVWCVMKIVADVR